MTALADTNTNTSTKGVQDCSLTNTNTNNVHISIAEPISELSCMYCNRFDHAAEECPATDRAFGTAAGDSSNDCTLADYFDSGISESELLASSTCSPDLFSQSLDSFSEHIATYEIGNPSCGSSVSTGPVTSPCGTTAATSPPGSPPSTDATSSDSQLYNCELPVLQTSE